MTTIADILAKHGPMTGEALVAVLVDEGIVEDRRSGFVLLSQSHEQVEYDSHGTLTLSALETSRRDPRPLSVRERLREALDAYEQDLRGEHIIPQCAYRLEQRIRGVVERCPEGDASAPFTPPRHVLAVLYEAARVLLAMDWDGSVDHTDGVVDIDYTTVHDAVEAASLLLAQPEPASPQPETIKPDEKES